MSNSDNWDPADSWWFETPPSNPPYEFENFLTEIRSEDFPHGIELIQRASQDSPEITQSHTGIFAGSIRQGGQLKMRIIKSDGTHGGLMITHRIKRIGTQDGRILMQTNDGCLYEILRHTLPQTLKVPPKIVEGRRTYKWLFWSALAVGSFATLGTHIFHSVLRQEERQDDTEQRKLKSRALLDLDYQKIQGDKEFFEQLELDNGRRADSYTQVNLLRLEGAMQQWRRHLQDHCEEFNDREFWKKFGNR